jgi:hypothetical protein
MVGKAQSYATIYFDRRKRFIEDVEEERKRDKPQLFLATSLVFTAVGSGLLEQTAKQLWEMIVS